MERTGNEKKYRLNHVFYYYINMDIYKFSDNKLNLHDISNVGKLYDREGRESEREPINSSVLQT